MPDPFFQNQVPPVNTTPPPVPSSSATPPQSATPQKRISRISMKTVIVGCATLFMVVVGGLTIIFYNSIKNPNQLVSLGIDPATMKTLLQAFAAIFFGLLTFLGIGILVNNLYRLITVKNRPKMRYAFAAIG